MSENSLPRAESRRRDDEGSGSSSRRRQLEAAEKTAREPNKKADEHRSVVDIKPVAAPTSPRKPPCLLPPALVLALRVALTLAVLAVPAIFLQNSDRRNDPLVAAVVTLECVSSW